MDAQKAENTRTCPDVDHWVDEHADVLFRYAIQRVRRRDVAEELVQETFVSALGASKTFSGRSSERTWLVGILRHKIVDHIRRIHQTGRNGQPNSEEVPVDRHFEKNGHWKNPVSDWRSDPVKILENRDFWAAFQNCFSALPDTLADAFALREMEDLASSDVCSSLGITESNLWVRLHRARVLLKECLEKNWFQQEPG